MPFKYGPWRNLTVISVTATQTVTETPLPDSTALTTDSVDSTLPTAASNFNSGSTTSSSSTHSQSLPVGPIVGGVVAAFALLLLFLFLLFKYRCSQRRSRLRATEIDPPMTLIPSPLDTRELGRYNNLNDGGSMSATDTWLSSAPTTVFVPQRARSAPSPNISPLRVNPSTRTNYTVHSPIQDEPERIQLSSYTSVPNIEIHRCSSLQSNSSWHDLSPHGATSGEGSTHHRPTYFNIPHQDANFQIVDPTTSNSNHSDRTFDSAPPAYSPSITESYNANPFHSP